MNTYNNDLIELFETYSHYIFGSFIEKNDHKIPHIPH